MCWRPGGWSWPTTRPASATTPKSRRRTWEHDHHSGTRCDHRGHDRRQSTGAAVRVADLGGRRVVADRAQGLRRAARPDAGPAAVGPGAPDRPAAARAPRLEVAGRGVAPAAAPPPDLSPMGTAAPGAAGSLE